MNFWRMSFVKTTGTLSLFRLYQVFEARKKIHDFFWSNSPLWVERFRLRPRRRKQTLFIFARNLFSNQGNSVLIGLLGFRSMWSSQNHTLHQIYFGKKSLVYPWRNEDSEKTEEKFDYLHIKNNFFNSLMNFSLSFLRKSKRVFRFFENNKELMVRFVYVRNGKKDPTQRKT